MRIDKPFQSLESQIGTVATAELRIQRKTCKARPETTTEPQRHGALLGGLASPGEAAPRPGGTRKSANSLHTRELPSTGTVQATPGGGAAVEGRVIPNTHNLVRPEGIPDYADCARCFSAERASGSKRRAAGRFAAERPGGKNARRRLADSRQPLSI